MSVFQGPNIATSSLVFDFDLYNTTKSWVGKPTINTCSFGQYNYWWSNAIVTRNTTAPVGKPPPVLGREIAKLQSTDGLETQTILYTASVNQVDGGVYTHSAYIYLESGTYVRVGQHWNPWDYGTYQYIPRGVWTRCSYTLTNYTNNYGNVACSYNTDGIIYITATQYELGSEMTPFVVVGSTRSNTQSILDLTNRNTVTATSLTYANNSFTFDGTNYMSISALGSISAFTVSVWFNSTAVENYRNVIDCNYNYNANTGNIGPRLEQNSAGGLGWIMSGNTGNNDVADSYSVMSSGMSANTWYNVVITRDGSNLVSTYLNGSVVVNQASNPNGFVNVMNSVNIGRGFSFGGGRYFKGTISNTQIYSRALSATEVKQNYDALRTKYGLS